MLTTLGIDIGIVNFSFCVLRIDQDGRQTVKRWERVNLLNMCMFPKTFSCKKIKPVDIHTIAETVLPKLFDAVDFIQAHEIHHVAIEQQPHGKYANTRMISFSHLVFAYFRRLVCRGVITTVRFMSASQKYQRKFLDQTGLRRAKGYKNRKDLGVCIVRFFCDKFGIALECFETEGKKDDLADSFLLAYSEQLLWVNFYGIKSELTSLGGMEEDVEGGLKAGSAGPELAIMGEETD